MTALHTELMQCMEVWGGNQVADSGVVMAGLDAWVYSHPHGQAVGGGDVYYVSSCATGRITRLLLADVSGHGQAVSAVAGDLRQLMRRFVNYLDQTAFVRALNRQFAALAADGCFATAVVCTFFAPNNHLSLCNAGHPPPLLYRAKTGQWSVLEQQETPRQPEREPGNFPLGMIDVSEYEQFAVRLRVGDLVLCYTDALIEAHAADGSWLGIEGLLQIVQRIDVTDPVAFTPTLLAALHSEAAGNLTDDDVSVLLFRPNGLAPRPPLRDKLLAPFRVMKGLAQSLRPGGPPMPWPELSLPNIGGALLDPFNRLWGKRDVEDEP